MPVFNTPEVIRAVLDLGSLHVELNAEGRHLLAVIPGGKAADPETQRRYRRLYTRSMFALLEGSAFALKSTALVIADPGVFTSGELYMLREEAYQLEPSGKVAEGKFRGAGVLANIRFALLAFARAMGLTEFELEPKSAPVTKGAAKLPKPPDGAALQRAIRIRDRITHPRNVNSLIITDEEYKAVEDTLVWYGSIFARLMTETRAVMTQRQVTLEEKSAFGEHVDALRDLQVRINAENAAINQQHVEAVSPFGARFERALASARGAVTAMLGPSSPRTRVMVDLDAATLDALDRLAEATAAQGYIPSRSEAARKLLAAALARM